MPAGWEKRHFSLEVRLWVDYTDLWSINPFVPNALFLYPLKTSENRQVFWCFQGLEKGCIGNDWVKESTNIENGDNFNELKVIKKTLVNIIIRNWITAYLLILSKALVKMFPWEQKIGPIFWLSFSVL